MNGFLAVLRREVAERRTLLAAAAFASLVPIAVPLSRGLSGSDAADARSVTALILSAAFAVGTAIALGASMLAPRIANRRIAFDLARPLSAFSLWGGRLTATTLLAVLCAAIVWIPALVAGGSSLAADIPLPLPGVGILLLVAVVGLFALFHAAAVAVASRSARLALDAVLVLVAGYGVSVALARLPRFMASEPFEIARMAFALAAVIAAMVAGYASVARGRTDIQAAHRALSLVLWAAVGAAVLGVNVYAVWVMAARPRDVGTIYTVNPAPAGGWTVITGPARGTAATFLIDTDSGRYARAPIVDWESPYFSLDGRHAAWVEGRDKGGPLPVWTWSLAEPGASPVRTRLLLHGYPSLTVLSDDGSRLAVVEESLLSIYELSSARALASVRVDAMGPWRAMFLGNDRLRLYRAGWVGGAPLEISELDIPARTLVKTGTFASSAGWMYLTADRSGDRLILISARTGEAWLHNGRTGQQLATLGSATPKARWAGFLGDGRIILTEAVDAGRILRVFSPDGAPVKTVSFPGARGLTLGGEAAPGRLIAAAGAGPEREIDLVDVDTGASRRIADRLYPAAHLASWSGQPNVSPAVGSEATKLFLRWGQCLVRLDPLTGKRRVILGEDRAMPRSSGTPRSTP
jgi:hypothetical protein